MNKPFKVLFITYPMAFHTPGGGEMQLLAYKKHLELQGVQVDLFNPWNPNFLDYDLVHFFSVIGGSVHLCNFIKQLGIPLVITSSLWITEEAKHLYPVDEIRHQLSLADVIIGNSDIECDQMSNVLGLPREKFATVYNGVEDIFFEPVPPELFRETYGIHDPFILNVGNIEQRKNQLNLAKAMKVFPDKKLVLIGHIRDPDYAEQVFAEGGNQIIHIGTLQHGSELHRSAYAACEVFCLPSTLETPGLAALEASACGAKIVITEIGATKEYFGENANYIDPNNVAQIVLSLQKNFSQYVDSQISRDKIWSVIIKRVIFNYYKCINTNQ